MRSLTEQFADWVRSKPADEAYDCYDINNCALAQFGKHAGMDHLVGRGKIPEALRIPILASGFEADWTFGALAERLSA